MVNGLNIFKDFFKGHNDKYILIGGTACDKILTDASLIPRATTDIDIILIVETLNVEFAKKFWEFIELGNYNDKQKSDIKKEFFRFKNPQEKQFPR